MKKSSVVVGIFLLSIKFGFCQQENPSTDIQLHFNNMVDNQSLILDDSLHGYFNAHGDRYYVTLFKYYISNVFLINTNDEKVAIPNSYILVNADDSSSLKQTLSNIPVGYYKGISFMIGVDSARNFAGAQDGSLDPANGMFWTWKSGYVFVKMEGFSPQSTNKKHLLVFHIGGVIAPNNTIRNYKHYFEQPIEIRANAKNNFNIAANINALFGGKNIINFSQLNSTMGGHKAMPIADNYANSMFSVKFQKH